MSMYLWKMISLLGLAVTAVIQSSSATTVMVVGFVNSGIMRLNQAVGVIMGSNVGTTVTAWILSLSGLRNGLCSVEYGFVPEDLLTAFGRIADHCSNIAVEMLQVAEGKPEAHEYLHALKSGVLHESAAFSEQFRKYRARYAFPDEIC